MNEQKDEPVLKLFLPIRLKTPNVREKWKTGWNRNRAHAWVLKKCLSECPNFEQHRQYLGLNLKHIRITRIGGRPMDYDNFVYSCKYIKDKLCDWLKPGLAPGQADRNVKVEYEQVKATKGNTLGIQIDLF